MVKFTPKGKIALSFERTTDVLKIEISDTGIVIDESNHEQIFKNFKILSLLIKVHNLQGLDRFIFG